MNAGKSRTQRVSAIMEEGLKLFNKKNTDYSEAYIHSTDLMSLLVPDKSFVQSRFQQIVYHNMYIVVGKLCRAANLIFHTKSTEVTDEGIFDTWKDIGVYANMIAELCIDRKNLGE